MYRKIIMLGIVVSLIFLATGKDFSQTSAKGKTVEAEAIKEISLTKEGGTEMNLFFIVYEPVLNGEVTSILDKLNLDRYIK